MKHTIKLDPLKALVIEPEGDSIRLTITVGSVPAYRTCMSQAMAGVLVSALEQVAADAGRAVAS